MLGLTTIYGVIDPLFSTKRPRFPLDSPKRGSGHILRERSSRVLVKQRKLSSFWPYSASLSTRDGVYLTSPYVFDLLLSLFLGCSLCWAALPILSKFTLPDPTVIA